MPVTCQQIIEASYNRSSANDAGKLADDAELILHLSRLHDRYVALLLRARSDEFATVAPTAPLAGAPPVVTLNPVPLDILHVATALGARVHLISAAERDLLYHAAPAVYRLTSNLVSRALAGDPIVGDVLTLTVLAAPTAIAALADLIDPRLPLRHHQLLIDALALYLDTKDEGRDQGEHAKLVTEYAQSTASFASEVGIVPDALERDPREVARHQPPTATGGR